MSMERAPGTLDPRLERLAIALLVVVAVLQVISFAWATPSNDYARDLQVAMHIANGDAFPMQGPIISGTIHVGPAWNYLLALPLALGFGFAGTTVVVGLLSMLKVLAAWRLGALLRGRALAIAFAALMLVPGWGLMHLLQLTHTVLVECLVIASLIPLLRLWRGEPARAWIWFGLLFGLAVHAHPVALFLALPATLVVLRRWHGLRTDLPWLGLGAVLAIAPALPALLTLWLSDAAAPQVTNMVTGGAGPHPVLAMLAMLRGLLLGGVDVVRFVAPPALGGVITVLFALLAIACASGLIALWRNRDFRTAWLVVMLGIVLGSTWLVLLRTNVSFYMAALVWPLVALAFAMPLTAGLADKRTGKIRYATGVIVALALGAVGSGAMIAQSQDGHAQLPLAGFQNIGATTQPLTPLALMPTWAFAKRARLSCGQERLLVHGELAALVDFYQGMPFSWRCGPTLQVKLMGADGSPGTAHWAGTTPNTLHLLGWRDAGWRQALRFAPTRVIHPAGSVPMAIGEHYPHRIVGSGEPVLQEFRFTAQHNEAIAVYAPLFVFDASQVVGASVNGIPVTPASITNSGALYLPPTSNSASIEWVVQARTREREQIDIVALPMAGH